MPRLRRLHGIHQDFHTLFSFHSIIPINLYHIDMHEYLSTLGLHINYTILPSFFIQSFLFIGYLLTYLSVTYTLIHCIPYIYIYSMIIG